MRAGVRATQVSISAAVLGSALAARALDGAGVLPGVAESTAVRGGPVGWLAALLAAGVVALLAARCWSSTFSVLRTALVVAGGQLAGFVAAESAARLADGLAPLDPDALAGAALQTVVAVTVLVLVTYGLDVLVRCAPLHALGPPPVDHAITTSYAARAVRAMLIPLIARGPPPAL